MRLALCANDAFLSIAHNIFDVVLPALKIINLCEIRSVARNWVAVKLSKKMYVHFFFLGGAECGLSFL